MSLKKLVTLLSMAFAAIALAAPAAASAEGVFTHEGTPITSGSKTVVFSGPYAFDIGGVGQVHCTNAIVTFDFEATGTGTVTSFLTEEEDETFCTSTPDNFVTHTTATGLPWTIQTNGHDTISIAGVNIDHTITHPATTHLVIAHRTLTGTFHATIPAGQTNDIEELTLSGAGTVDLHRGAANGEITGELERTTETQVGTATVDTG